MESAPDSITPSFMFRFGGQSRWLLAELIVIIAGVLIALGIDEWRGHIEEVALEKEYLDRLIDDLRSTEELMAETPSINASARDAANGLLAAFEDEKYPRVDRVRELLSEMRFLYLPTPLISTVESMVSSGDLRLIREPTIRAHIIEYLAYARDGWIVPINQRTERHRELLFQTMMLAQSHGISPRHVKGPYVTSTEAAQMPDVAGFFADPRAYVYVAKFAENRTIMVIYLDDLSAEAKRVREALEAYLSSQ